MKLIAQILLFSLPCLALAGEAGRSYTPIVGYDDKNGALYGAAVFFYQDGRPGYQAALHGVSNGRSFHSVTFNWEQRKASGLDLSLKSSLSRAFDQYYGEGDATSGGQPLRLDQDLARTEAVALLAVAGGWSVGPSLGLKVRRETGVSDHEGRHLDGVRAFADSADPALGLRLQHDDRNSSLNPSRGGLLQLDLRALPGRLALLGQGQDAWQGEAEWRNFMPLGHGVVLAQRLSGGLSAGQPGYAERYSLGGTSLLRGFEDNRFRGSRYYGATGELRAPLWKMLSAAASLDLGDAGDGRLEHPRRSAQLGLRAGLPPSYGMQARLDTGFGDGGERSMMLQFGHTF